MGFFRLGLGVAYAGCLAWLAACGASTPPPATPPPPPLVAAADASPPPPPPRDVTLAYDIVFGSRIAGSTVIVRHPDDSYDEDFAYTDRGRGPSYHTHTEIDRDFLPGRIEVTGNDYMHRPVRELLTCTGERCKWDSDREHGEGKRGFYVALYSGAPDEALLRATLAAGGRLALLPGGSVTAEKLGELTVSRGADSKESMQVVAWQFSGFGLVPVVTWFDTGGALFASVSDGGATIAKGWRAAIPALRDAQGPFVQARLETIAKTVAHRPKGELAIVHARLFDPATKRVALDTLGAARVMKRDKTGGSVAPGKDADLVIVDGDPLTRMRDVRNVVTVVKGGVVIDAVAAQAALSIAPAGT